MTQLLGFPHPDYLLPWLTAEQYTDWLAWLAKYHASPDRHDPLWAMLLAMTNNAHCVEGREKKPEDFMIYVDPLEEIVTAEELLRRMGL